MEKPQQISIKVDEATAKGLYANNMIVGHSKEEFVLDFMNVFPPEGRLVARIFTSPAHAKRILGALSENIKKYESQFGEIKESGPPEEDLGFRLGK